uniref:Uncharacterized protein n=1 Tax=Anguilla anguilla TaxID=7936 RepID=A0A0E9XZ07_ANGAN
MCTFLYQSPMSASLVMSTPAN